MQIHLFQFHITFTQARQLSTVEPFLHLSFAPIHLTKHDLLHCESRSWSQASSRVAATDNSEARSAAAAAAALHPLAAAAAAAINATPRTDATTRSRACVQMKPTKTRIKFGRCVKRGKRRQGRGCKDTGCRER